MVDAPNLIRDGGAVPDGITDNSAAFATWMTLVHKAGVGYIPGVEGEYRCGLLNFTPTNKRLRIYGDGDSSKIRIVNPGGPSSGILCYSGSYLGDLITLEKFRLLAPMGTHARETGCSAISFRNMGGAIVQDVYADGWWSGLYFSLSWAFRVNGGTFSNMRSSAVHTDPGDDTPNGCTIQGIRAFACGGELGKGAIELNNGGAINVSGNDCEGGWAGAVLNNIRSGVFSGNWTEGNSAFSWRFNSCNQNNLHVFGNELDNGSFA